MKYTGLSGPNSNNRWGRGLSKLGHWMQPSPITHSLESLCKMTAGTAIPELFTELEGDFYSGDLTEAEVVKGILAAFPFLIDEKTLNVNRLREIARFCELIKDVRKSMESLGGLPSQRSLLFNRVTRRFNNFVRVNKTSSVKMIVLLKLSNTENLLLSTSVEQIRNAEFEEWKLKFEALCATREIIGTTRFKGGMPIGNSHEAVTLRWAWRQKNKYMKGLLSVRKINALNKIDFFLDHDLTN